MLEGGHSGRGGSGRVSSLRLMRQGIFFFHKPESQLVVYAHPPPLTPVPYTTSSWLLNQINE